MQLAFVDVEYHRLQGRRKVSNSGTANGACKASHAQYLVSEGVAPQDGAYALDSAAVVPNTNPIASQGVLYSAGVSEQHSLFAPRGSYRYSCTEKKWGQTGSLLRL